MEKYVFDNPIREVDFIIKLLEKRYRTKFSKRIKIGGWIDSPEYRLVVSNYLTAGPNDELFGIYGDISTSVIDIYEKFLSFYWHEADLFSSDSKTRQDAFYKTRRREWEKMKVADSREEFMLMMTVGGENC